MIIILFTLICCLSVTLFALGIVKYLHLSQEKVISVSSDDAVLITGCDSGIGLELAKYFYETCKLKVICGFLQLGQSDGFKELSKILEVNKDNRLLLESLDITNDRDIQALGYKIDSLRSGKVFKNLIAVINNAGTMTYGEFDWLTWDQIQGQIDVNLTGTLRLTRAMLPYIIECKGRFVNVSSVNDTTVFPGLSVYSATKSALSTFSKGLGYELRKFGAHVVTVRLGDFAKLTQIMKQHQSKKDDMWNEMSSKKKVMYKDFFHQFNLHLMKNYGMTSPKGFKESSLFNDFRRAVLNENPPSTIMCAPWTFKIFYSVIELTPVWIQYYLLDLLMQFGFKWKPTQTVMESSSLDAI